MNGNNRRINDHVEEYLDYYCESSYPPNYAILLKGEWGSGKTWFIEKYRKKLEEKDQKCLYVSLYGMTTFSEIGDSFFQQLHPILSSTGMVIAGNILKGFLKGTLKIDLNSDSKEDGTINYQIPDINLPNYLKNTDKSILIFDDLERCKIDIESILGYINNFVEHQNMKVIVIANEEELLKKNNNLEPAYKVIKEKLIGKTFSIHTDLNGAIENFINSIENPDSKKFLVTSTPLIRELYETAKYKNLRSLKQIIWDFDRIFKVLPAKAKNKPEFLEDLLQILIAFSIEIKRGAISPKDISKLKDQYNSNLLASVREKSKLHQEPASNQNNDNREENRLQNILDKYERLNLHQPFPDERWWQDFFDEGIINMQELEKVLSISNYFQDENTPNWVRLWHFLHLTDDDFCELLKIVEAEYLSRKLSNLEEIKHVTGIFLEFSNIGLYLRNKKTILQDAKSYIDGLDSIKQISLIKFNEESTNYSGLGFYGKNLDEFKEFCDYINCAVEKAIDLNMPNAGQELLNTMQNDVWKFGSMIRLSDSQELSYHDPRVSVYSQTPIFSHIQPTAFVKILLQMSSRDQRSVSFELKKRYDFDDINKKLIEEYEWLKSVRDLLRIELTSQRAKLSRYRLRLIIEDCLDVVIKKLEKFH